MSMGIEDPVTRDAYKSTNEYYRQLAMQLAQILDEPIKVTLSNIVQSRVVTFIKFLLTPFSVYLNN